MSTVHERRVARSIAEIAESSHGSTEFRRAALACLQQAIGFDLALLQSTKAGTAVGLGFPYGDARLTAESIQVSSEFGFEEVRRMMTGRLLHSDEVFTPDRRDRLYLFRRVLRPIGVHSEVAAIWSHGSTVTGLVLARERATSRFSETSRRLIESLFPLLSTADVLLARQAQVDSATWASAHALTPAQQRVAELIVRGLNNREVGQILGCSELTVRNHLVAVYRKVNVTTRAELVFCLLNGREQGSEAPWLSEWSERMLTGSRTR